MIIDSVALARLQFGATASFHIIFPSLILGLALYLTVMEVCWLQTKNDVYRDQYQFWIKPFISVFLVGVVTGIVLSYQLDTNFGGLYRKTEAILMPIREIEFLNAVVLEAGCFGIMAWGWQRVGDKLHFVATLAVTAGVTISSVCILMRNAWMQTPSGAAMVGGELMLNDRMAALFSPSFPYRLSHVVGGACLCTAFFVLGISAWYLLQRRHQSFAKYSFRVALAVISVVAPLQIISGDLHGLNTLEYQPSKIAAIEGIWETARGVPMVLFAIPDQVQERNRLAIEIPSLASLILKHDPDGEIRGLKEFPRGDRPNIPLVFYSFRIMAGAGVLMLALPMLWHLLLRRRLLPGNRWFLWCCCAMLPSGFIATIAGWCVAEAGRQPWAIYGIARTADIFDAVPASHVDRSLLYIGLAYMLISALFIAFLGRTIKRGPYASGL
jgi:cytochrome bd ubiquinol oxidase subunit I